MRRFEDQLLGPWWQRRGESNGLSQDHRARRCRRRVEGAARRGGFTEPSRPLAPSTHRLLDPLALAHGAQAGVESEPSNAEVAGTLIRIFRDIHIIHSVRDGRDVACSIVPLHWGPTDVDDGLDWWAARVEEAFAACETLPDDQLLVLQMEDLIDRDRDASYERLLSYLGIDDDPAMRAYFASDVTAEKAHIGHWREDVPEDRRVEFDAHFQRLATALVARGRRCSWDGAARPRLAMTPFGLGVAGYRGFGRCRRLAGRLHSAARP